MLTSDKITNLNWSLHNFKIEEGSSLNKVTCSLSSFSNLNKVVFELHQHSV